MPLSISNPPRMSQRAPSLAQLGTAPGYLGRGRREWHQFQVWVSLLFGVEGRRKGTRADPKGLKEHPENRMKEVRFDKVGSNLRLLTWKRPIWEVLELIPTIPAPHNQQQPCTREACWVLSC